MKTNKIAIIGTIGIPAKYGGFETLTEHLTRQLGRKLQITVYCSSQVYSHKLKIYNNSHLEYISINGNGIQSIPYDIASLFKAAKSNETILILGVSGCIVLPIFRLFYQKKRLIINIDGLEHKREKWNKLAKVFLKYSEKIAIRNSNEVIADNEAIQEYVKKEYGRETRLIAYGGNHANKILLSDEIRQKYSLPEKYALKVCRIEPENNVKLILEAFALISFPLIIIGNWTKSKYGMQLRNQFGSKKHIHLLDPIYDQGILNQIRSNCAIYLHGHSAGGTNPALVEAMSLGLPIVTFDCVYNRATTLDKALYFSNVAELKFLVESTTLEALNSLREIMLKIAKENYTWEKIANQYFEILK